MDFAKDLSIEQSHRYVEFRADQSSYSESSAEAVIDVDVPLASGEYVDMTDSRLIFSLTPTYASGSLYQYAASGWMRDFSVRAHNQTEIGQQCVNYNRFVKVQKIPLSSNDNADSWESILEGATVADLPATTASAEFAHKPIVNIFTHDGYYPAFAHKGFQIRINIDGATSLGAACSAFTISNLRLECRLVKLKPEVHNQVLNQLASPEGIVFDFESTECVSKTVSAGSNQIFQFGRVAHRLKRVQVVQSETGGSNAPDVFEHNGLTSWRFRLGSEYSTPTAIDVSTTQLARHVLHYLRAHKISPEEMNVYGKTLPDTTTNFVVAFGYDMSKVDELISSADSKGLDLELHTTGTLAAAAMYLFKTEDRRVQILSGSMLQMLS